MILTVSIPAGVIIGHADRGTLVRLPLTRPLPLRDFVLVTVWLGVKIEASWWLGRLSSRPSGLSLC